MSAARIEAFHSYAQPLLSRNARTETKKGRRKRPAPPPTWPAASPDPESETP